MKNLILILMGILALRATAAENVIFVVDISGSMTYELPKVKGAILQQSQSPAFHGGRMGLVSFSGCGPKYVYELVPLAKNNLDAMKAGVEKLRPEGATDIVTPLKHVQGMIRKLLADTDECANVILFTDDIENCHPGTPHKAILKEIQRMCSEKKSEFKLDVVSAASSEDTKLFLDSIVSVTGGKVHIGGTVDEISEKLKQIVEGYGKKSTGTPLQSKATKPDETTGGKKETPVPSQAPQKLPATQGKEKKDDKKGGGP